MISRNKMLYLTILATALIATAWIGWKFTARDAYETAEYTLIESEGAFEIRDYPDLELATTSMQSDLQGDDGSFMRLFQYISGANRQRQKVAMTTPVFMEPRSDDQPGNMGFVLPAKVAAQKAPQPDDGDVSITTRAGGQFAVYRFAGRINEEATTDAETKLRQWIDAKGLQSSRNAEFAGYDPPWTPGLLRRNEVLLRIDSPD